MKTLYLAYDGMTDPLGQSQVLPYLIGLSREGYKIDLVSFEKEIEFNQEKDKIEQLCSTNGINWIPLNYTKRPPVLSTIWDIFKLKRNVQSLHKQNKYKLIHCRSYITALIGLKMKRKHQVPFLFDMRGFWADERVDGGLWNLDNKIYKKVYHFFKKKEQEFFQEANHVISLTHAGKNEILSWEKLVPKPTITVIPCCVDLELFNYEGVTAKQQQVWIDKFDLSKSDISLVYLGSFSTVYKFQDTLDIYKKFKLKYPNLKFIVLSKEPKELFNEFLQESNIKDKGSIYFSSVQREEVPIILSLMDYSIFFCDPAFSRKATSPTRMAELLACGVPVLTNEEIGDSGAIIKANNCGNVLESFTDKSKEEFIGKINLNQAYNKKQLRQVSLDRFNLKEGVLSYKKVYDSLT